MADNEEMKNTELSEQDMEDVTGGGKHCKDGRLIITDLYHCNYYEYDNKTNNPFNMQICGNCRFRNTSGGWIVCDHPGNRN